MRFSPIPRRPKTVSQDEGVLAERRECAITGSQFRGWRKTFAQEFMGLACKPCRIAPARFHRRPAQGYAARVLTRGRSEVDPCFRCRDVGRMAGGVLGTRQRPIKQANRDCGRAYSTLPGCEAKRTLQALPADTTGGSRAFSARP